MQEPEICRREVPIMKSIRLSVLSGPSALEVVESERPAPGPGEVLVRHTSIGLNRSELMATRGHYPASPLPAPMGLEAGGWVEELGADVAGWSRGDRVTPIFGAYHERGRGSWAEYGLVAAKDLVRSPRNLPDHVIGGLWLPFVTAWHALHHVAEVDDAKVVVIPAASSSVGLAAIQVCLLIGARPIALTTHAGKIPAIVQATGIAEADIVVSTQEALEDGLDRILGPGGLADIFFDPIGGDFLEEELRRVRDGGIIVLYGSFGGRGQLLTGLIPMKRVRIVGYHLGMLKHDLDLTNKDNTYNVLVRRFENEELRPTVAETYPLEAVGDALEAMAQNLHVGKFYLVT